MVPQWLTRGWCVYPMFCNQLAEYQPPPVIPCCLTSPDQRVKGPVPSPD